jgi:hypothetical protein
VRPQRSGNLKTFIRLMGSWTHDLQACNISTLTTIIPRIGNIFIFCSREGSGFKS